MDRAERYEDYLEAVRVALRAHQSHIWTVMPAILESYDQAKMICVAQPAIKGLQQLPKVQELQPVTMPLCVDCPVIFPCGGGFTLTFPLAKGDEGLLFFASRCIDDWWQSGGVGGQIEFRMHDLSDGFFLAGPRSQPRVLQPAPHAANTQLRSDDGEAFVEIKPNHDVHVQTTGTMQGDADGDIILNAGGKIRLNAPELELHGQNMTMIDAGGTGYVYQPNLLQSWTDGVPGQHFAPNPPEVPS